MEEYALAVSSLKRSIHLPEVPTLDESGMAGFDVVVWYAIFAPAATPKMIVARLHAELVKAIASNELRERLMGPLGVNPMSSTPEQLAQFSKSEIEKWRRVAQQAGVKID